MSRIECVETRSNLDLMLGMECYMTREEPLIPYKPLDQHNFYVYEFTREMGILRPPIKPLLDRGNIFVYLLIKRGIDTYNAMKILKRYLRPKRISYYGLKDARASTYQAVTVEEPENLMTYILDRNLEAILVGITSKHARRGDIIGNCFKINIGEIIGNTGKDLLKILFKISEHGYIPNYYSYQRFGVARPITHIVGLALLCNQLEKAIYALINGRPPGNRSTDEMMLEIIETCRKIIDSGPRWMHIEKRICSEYLSSRDAAKALKRVSREYIELYISAAYSYLFNLYLSYRWKKHGLGLQIAEGEVLLRSRLFGLQIPGKELSSKDIEGEYREIYITSIETFGLEPCIPKLRSIIRRPLILPIEIDLLDPDLNIIWFCLDPGGYATNLLREIFKFYSAKLFSPDLNIGTNY